ncbi:MAG: AAA domain-containing protein [Patescibacteria group bacterium]
MAKAVTEPNNFVKEVAKYFMNFLETDFKKRRVPKRNTIQKTNNGLKVAVDLDKFIDFKQALLKQFAKSFENQSLVVKKNEYTTKIPTSLLKLIISRVEALKSKDITQAHIEIEKRIYDCKTKYNDSYDQYLEEGISSIKSSYSKVLIYPFLQDLDKPLENLGLADENSKFQLETDIIDTLFGDVENQLTDLLQKIFEVKEGAVDFDIVSALEEIIPLESLKAKLTMFFENSAVSDLFSELYQIYRNGKLIDKTEIYFYFFELSLGNETFPLFYMPIHVEKDEDRFILNFEHRIYVNSQGLDFVVQEFNRQSNRKSTLAVDFERVIYINSEDDFFDKVTTIVRKIENFLELGLTIDIQDARLQKGLSLITGLSNKCYIFLFDKSDEALINDYEKILNDDGELIEDFTHLLDGFIKENPKSFIDEIDTEWQELSCSTKLIVESPIPLNDEQKQVLMALQKPDCKFMILEGPPGTGKSHTITAIICKALLEEKSVLVLSDKKEALDVVEEKIAGTLNKIRHEEDFQNPILRLGGSGNKFYKIVQGQTIQKIKNHYLAYKKTQESTVQQKDLLLTKLKNDLETTIKHFDAISIDDIIRYFELENKLSFENDLIKNEDLEGLEKLPKLKELLEQLSFHTNANYSKSFINEKNTEKLQELLKNVETSKQIISSLEGKKTNDAYRELGPVLGKDKASNLLSIKHILRVEAIFNHIISLKALSEWPLYKQWLKSNLFSELEYVYGDVVFVQNLFQNALKFNQKYSNDLGKLHDLYVDPDIDLDTALNALNKYIKNVKSLRKPIFGFFFNKSELNDLTRELKKTFNYFNIENPEKKLDSITYLYDLLYFIQSKIVSRKRETFDNVFQLLSNYKNSDYINAFDEFFTDIKEIHNIIVNFDALKNLNPKLLLCYVDILNLERISSELNAGFVYLENEGLKIIDKELSTDVIKNDINTERIKEYCNSCLVLAKLSKNFEYVEEFIELHPGLAKELNINIEGNINEFDFLLLEKSEELLGEIIDYKHLESKLTNSFTNAPADDYITRIETVEQLITAQMTYFLDKRIIEYSQDNAGEVNTLKTILKNKQEFPIALFKNLKKAFPCILAGIRDYAEYIPLEKDLFDLIIIDEASQVSISQALPALIRGKQVIVLGDDKQFSNVKAGNASTVTNQQYKTRIKEVFRAEKINGEDKMGWETKVRDNFDIKNSILKFSRFIRNYQCQLQKHFRCYPEIISYSDKYFYHNTLQSMKIRGVPLTEVIKFDVIKHDGKLDKNSNTNELEIKHIVNVIKQLKADGFTKTIGIITPHREQVTLLFDVLNKLEEREWLFSDRKLKIMTFDTCQGEERDYIFYSMVATKEKDMLNWIFPVLFDENKDNVKAQRLNVGFSRAKDCIHFVLSKPIEEFKGELRNALIHYRDELINGKNTIIGGTDPNSPMEVKIQEIFYLTKFYKDNKDTIEFIPQFDLGKYLKQLSREYTYPEYKVDFLLIFKNKKIIVEYDGFREHFTQLENVNASNYISYMNSEDIYRQKVLEGYGYSFLRINRFNIGKDPVATLDARINEIVKKK